MSYKFKTGSMSVKTEDGFKDIGILVGASGGVDSTELATIKQEQGAIKESLLHLEEEVESLSVGAFPSSKAKILCDWITAHVVLKDMESADGLYELLTGESVPDTPTDPTPSEVTVSYSGGTLAMSGFKSTPSFSIS